MLQGGIVLLYTNAMRLGLLAEPSMAEQMEKLLAQGPFYDLPDRLVDAANENGGSDNITALLLAVEPTEVHHG